MQNLLSLSQTYDENYTSLCFDVSLVDSGRRGVPLSLTFDYLTIVLVIEFKQRLIYDDYISSGGSGRLVNNTFSILSFLW